MMQQVPSRPKLRRVRLVTVDCNATASGAPIIRQVSDAAAIARAVLPTDREGFAVIHLDSRGSVRSVELATVGILNASLAHPREIFKAAILANAAKVILAHNHPSGDPEPSEEDFSVTRRLISAGDILGIGVLDHVIVAEHGVTSLRDERWGLPF
jgi:DNA repair protein RadC